jgi:glycosyltransferase involved in cell wall biosynthesis
MRTIAFGSTNLYKGLRTGGIDGIGRYCQELIKQFQKDSSLNIAPFTFGEQRRPGINCITLPSYYSYLPRAHLQAALGMADLNFSKVDLIHATDQWMPLVKDRPIIATVMDSIPLSHPQYMRASFRYLKSFFWKQLTRKADHIITISEFSKSEIAKHFNYPEHQISSIPLGVDESYCDSISVREIKAVLEKFSLPENFFISIGTLQPRKNTITLLKAHSQLPPKLAKDFPIVIVGRSGWDKNQEIELAIQASSAKGECIWINYITEFEKRSLLQKAIGMPFISLYEGFGLPIVEAFASGTPVITSNITSMPEVSGDSALLVDPNNIDEITYALLRLIEDQTLRKSLKEKGITRSKKYSWENTAIETKKIYGKYC